MDTLKVALLIFLAVIAWGLVAIAIWGVPKTSKRQAEELAEQAEALKQDTANLEDGWIVDLERAMPVLRTQLAKLRDETPTLECIGERARIHVALLDAERALFTLKQRRAFGGDRQTAATVFEGRM